jgi:hypothetical protein
MCLFILNRHKTHNIEIILHIMDPSKEIYLAAIENGIYLAVIENGIYYNKDLFNNFFETIINPTEKMYLSAFTQYNQEKYIEQIKNLTDKKCFDLIKSCKKVHDKKIR